METPPGQDQIIEEILKNKISQDLILEVHSAWMQSEGNTRKEVYQYMCGARAGIMQLLADLESIAPTLELNDDSWQTLIWYIRSVIRKEKLSFYVNSEDPDDADLLSPLMI